MCSLLACSLTIDNDTSVGSGRGVTSGSLLQGHSPRWWPAFRHWIRYTTPVSSITTRQHLRWSDRCLVFRRPYNGVCSRPNYASFCPLDQCRLFVETNRRPLHVRLLSHVSCHQFPSDAFNSNVHMQNSHLKDISETSVLL